MITQFSQTQNQNSVIQFRPCQGTYEGQTTAGSEGTLLRRASKKLSGVSFFFKQINYKYIKYYKCFIAIRFVLENQNNTILFLTRFY